ADGHAEMRQPAHEIGRAVDRVDDPDRARIALGAGLFRANGMLWIGLVDGVDDRRLGALVGLGDVIVFAFAFNAAGLAAAVILQYDATGTAGGGDRDIGQGMHANHCRWLRRAAAEKAHSVPFAARVFPADPIVTENSSRIDSLARLRIVLVSPQHPGNIGAAARAMKVMGLSDLALVTAGRKGGV